MISLKRNRYGIPVEATGLRSNSSSRFIPNTNNPFKISRSKFNDFLTCMRCFYLDRVMGIISPSMPGWTLNETVDLLLKKEFDLCRDFQIPHRIFYKYGLDNVVPFKHNDLDKWRDSLHHGLNYKLKGTNITLFGGIDDVWFNQEEENLIVVDYKSQSNKRAVTTEHYLAGVFHQSYKVQLEFYAYLLNKMGFDVSNTGYFYVCNADREANSFEGKMGFDETLVPYELNISWIEPKISEMLSVLNSYEIPSANPSCENCAYARQRTTAEHNNKIL